MAGELHRWRSQNRGIRVFFWRFGDWHGGCFRFQHGFGSRPLGEGRRRRMMKRMLLGLCVLMGLAMGAGKANAED